MKPIFERKLNAGTFYTFNDRPKTQLKALNEFQHVHQVHGNEVLLASLTYNQKLDQLENADGLYFLNEDKYTLCIVTADCLPVVIEGKKGVAHLHAGWKGLENKILLSEKVKSIEPVFAFIGPCICRDHYQVGQEFKQYFDASSLCENSKGLYFDLAQEAKKQLMDHYGDLGIKVESSGICTFDHPNLNSYRENKTSQRNYNLYVPHV